MPDDVTPLFPPGTSDATKLQGRFVAQDAPTAGEALEWDDTLKEWKPAAVAAGAAWGGITGTLSAQTDLQSALDAKQASLGFTAENVANKTTDGTLAAASDTLYPSEKAVKTYSDTKQAALGFTAENVANKDTDGTLAGNSDTKYASQKATKTYADTKLSGNQTITLSGGVTGSGATSITATVAANTRIASVGFTTDGAGSVLTTGLIGYVTVPYAGTITAWSITADGTSPTCTIDVWRVGTGTALPAVGNTIMGTKPALSTANAIRSTTMTGWNPTAVTANDILGFNLDAVTVATKITFQLEITKTA